MRTGTITFHAPNNNGSFLQAFALQQVLTKEIGVENEIINFQSEKQINQYKTFRSIKSKNDLLKNIVALPHFLQLDRRYKRFEYMRSKYLKQTTLINEECDVLRLAEDYDVVVAGSDQIWNTGAPDFSQVYMLPGLKAKKISYAVSCGSVANEAGLKKYKEAINEFSNVSVRESTVEKRLEKLYDKKIDIVLNPTLLLTKEAYDEIYEKEPLIKGDYIFYYSINYSRDSLRAVKLLSQKTKLPVYTIFTSFHTSIAELYGIKVIYDGGPSEFLNFITNAKIVATNSFHGTAFSIIFKKNFYHLCNIDEYKMKKDDRIDGLLEQIGLEERNYSYLSRDDLPLINYDEVDIRLDELRKESVAYLKNALNN